MSPSRQQVNTSRPAQHTLYTGSQSEPVSSREVWCISFNRKQVPSAATRKSNHITIRLSLHIEVLWCISQMLIWIIICSGGGSIPIRCQTIAWTNDLFSNTTCAFLKIFKHYWKWQHMIILSRLRIAQDLAHVHTFLVNHSIITQNTYIPWSLTTTKWANLLSLTKFMLHWERLPVVKIKIYVSVKMFLWLCFQQRKKIHTCINEHSH